MKTIMAVGTAVLLSATVAMHNSPLGYVQPMSRQNVTELNLARAASKPALKCISQNFLNR